MKEKLQEYALITEIVSGIAILITLAILIIEVRNNTAAIELQVAENRSAASMAPFFNPQTLPGLYAKVKEVDGLDDEEIIAFMAHCDMSIEEAISGLDLSTFNGSNL